MPRNPNRPSSARDIERWVERNPDQISQQAGNLLVMLSRYLDRCREEGNAAYPDYQSDESADRPSYGAKVRLGYLGNVSIWFVGWTGGGNRRTPDLVILPRNAGWDRIETQQIAAFERMCERSGLEIGTRVALDQLGTRDADTLISATDGLIEALER